MTPYMWRNFVTGASTAREGQNGTIFFAKNAFHIQIVREKPRNRTKNGQKTSKRGVFISPSDQLAKFILKSCQLLRSGLNSWQFLRTNLASWSEGLIKTPFFWRVFACFLSCLLLFHRQFVYNTDILTKKLDPAGLF